MTTTHVTVLKKEAVEGLSLRPEAIIVDATLGAGGHARDILSQLNSDGMLIALDADESAIEALEGELKGDATVHLITANFRTLDSVLTKLDVPHVDGVLADLGWRMEQFAGGGKGFSFQHDEPLTMTFGNPTDEDSYPFTAKDIINEWSEESIANVLKGYGEERFAKRIARKIVEERESAPIETSGQLVEIISSAVPGFYRTGKTHPATRSFQALRIAVNDELASLEEFIQVAVQHLSPNGRLAIITFHSIEDRIVKHTFRTLAAEHGMTIITKKPVTASKEELAENPRARSAKLRIIQKN
ncbi:16S rRNA (cytosine(1402)-N(4))-methyltransferase RsmH [Candidatus Parcubacteria bacterium]|uniref:Ribosomal RNA small subunit methyltransferase H n=1 Tax=Candidatus Kaiserbacteria bacterium CG10_big_fil_rev_8_21_14_0_10_47_16 TaxID=1974608 RepID=A0A2H0UD44_9BACT|nr:16S rRNA (cytosine(1402)-N(4))-methyltransferase RsmH [Candidatus Parcubacteria bacterium]PIR84329.1 MAG: 16S rRNA (cytosine(1402)-N(4))-methyltransferase [Candidatus Kaiserbacteria bacterium CG10_big_fil_rev_8_21_14_0_10_47_16]